MLDIILAFVWAFLLAIFAIPSIIFVSYRKHLLDEPNHRTIHESLTPRLGGLAIFAGFMSAITIFGDMKQGIQQLLAGCLIIFFIGVKDDLVTVSALKKFFVQVLSAGIIMFVADLRIMNFHGILGILELTPGISYTFTFFVIIGITNSVNLIDGLDGLAGSIIMVISITFGIYFFQYGQMPYAFVAFTLAGAVLGFLRYNFFKAKVFMGDTGSLLCGFIVSVMSIKFIESDFTPASPAMAIAILFVPIFDTLRVFVIRLIQGKSPFYPDNNHIHHHLLNLGFSQIWVVVLLILLNVFVIAIEIYYVELGNMILMIGSASIMFVIGLVLYILNARKGNVAQDK